MTVFYDPLVGLKARELYAVAASKQMGGLSASGRANAVLGQPFYVATGEGAHVQDVDGRRFIDMCMSHGASLLGHRAPEVLAAVARAGELGFITAYETEFQTEAARLLIETFPAAESVRFTGSGTEATWNAIRIARAFTGRAKIIKFEGHFHGFNDYLSYSYWPPLAQAGEADNPIPYPETAGVPAGLAEYIIVLPFNNLERFAQAMAQHGDEVAAVIMEPVNYNAGGIMPDPDFLQLVRHQTREHGVVLIFDEILSSFRVGPGGAQAYLGVTPDLCTIGKALAGGVPLSAIAGQERIMRVVAPVGRVMHTGTYNAHLIPILAAINFLNRNRQPDFYTHIHNLAARLYSGLEEVIRQTDAPVHVQGLGARFGLYFGVRPPFRNWRDVAGHDRQAADRFFAASMRRGVFWHTAWHHGFSVAHTAADIDTVLNVAEAALREVFPRG